MDFRLLGAFEIDGQTGALRRQERSLLSILLLRANDAVALTELIDLLWPEQPPADARGSLQVYLSRLRAALPGVSITSTAAGYAVQVDPGAVDVHRFRRQVAAAREQTDPVLRSAGLRAALELWRGEPLSDLLPLQTRDRLRAGLLEEHAAAIEDRVEADLLAGRHEALAEELAELVRADPQRERLVVAWMTALYRSGRKLEALQAYEKLAGRLAEEFGLEPAPTLRRLHLAMLRDEPSLQLTAAGQGSGSVPRELPVDISLLVGRDELVSQAVQELTAEHAAVLCLWGGAGVGKSAAATRIGHLIADAFPDGQLFARLQNAGEEASPARTLLGRMLRSLGLKPARVPSTLAEREQLFRTLTADRAVLVVLDDALDAETVRSLLPAGDRCAAIVTSRKPMPELADAVHQQVTPLDRPTSRALLNRLIGRVLREQPTLDVIADECAGLPLALRIVGSRLALSGDDAVPALAGALADDDRRLDSMVAGDLAVRTSLSRTMTLADPEARHLLERLPLVGVTEFPTWVAAPLLDRDEATGAAAFGRLVDLGLVELVNQDRYKMHALVRSYAAEQLAAGDAADESLDRYLRAVYKLEVLADNGLKHGMTLAAESPTPDYPELPRIEAAAAADGTRWFEDSWPLIDAAVHAAIRSGRIEFAAWLGLRINSFYVLSDQREQRIELLEAIRSALPAAGGATDLELRIELGLIPAYQGSAAELLAMSEAVVAKAALLGSPELQARGLIQVANHARHNLDFERDREALEQALELVDGPYGPWDLRIPILRNLATNSFERHEYATAERWYREVLEDVPKGGLPELLVVLLFTEVLVEGGRHSEAEAMIERGVELCRAVRSEFYEAHFDCLAASLAIKRGELGEARRRLDIARTWFEKTPRVRVGLLVGAYEADLAMANGDVETGRKIRLDLIEAAEKQGDLLASHQVRYILDNDLRDPANQR